MDNDPNSEKEKSEAKQVKLARAYFKYIKLIKGTKTNYLEVGSLEQCSLNNTQTIDFISGVQVYLL